MTVGDKHTCSRCGGGFEVARIEVRGWNNITTRRWCCVLCRITMRSSGVEFEFTD
jgi:hypothetical protein